MNKNSLDFMNFSHPIDLSKSVGSSPRAVTSRSPRNDPRAFSARSNAFAKSARTVTLNSSLYLSSTVRMQPVLAAWEELSYAIHDYSKRCFLDETRPELLTQFCRAEHHFNDFNRMAKTVFNNLRPSRNLMPMQILPSAALLKTGMKVLDEWKQFVDLFYKVATGDVYNQFELMSQKYKALSKTMYGLGLRFVDPQPTVAISAVRKVKAYIDFIRKTADQQARAARMCSSDKFNSERFQQRLIDLNSWVRNLFENIIPKSSMSINGFASLHRELLVACNELQLIFEGICNFQSFGGQTKKFIDDVNVELDKYFQSLNLPLSVAQVFNPDAPTNPETAQNLEQTDKIHNQITEIQEALNTEAPSSPESNQPPEQIDNVQNQVEENETAFNPEPNQPPEQTDNVQNQTVENENAFNPETPNDPEPNQPPEQNDEAQDQAVDNGEAPTPEPQ